MAMLGASLALLTHANTLRAEYIIVGMSNFPSWSNMSYNEWVQDIMGRAKQVKDCNGSTLLQDMIRWFEGRQRGRFGEEIIVRISMDVQECAPGQTACVFRNPDMLLALPMSLEEIFSWPDVPEMSSEVRIDPDDSIFHQPASSWTTVYENWSGLPVTPMDAASSLIHELWHAYAHGTGKFDSRTIPGTTLTYEELNAMRAENIWRRNNGLPIAINYAEFDIGDYPTVVEGCRQKADDEDDKDNNSCSAKDVENYYRDRCRSDETCLETQCFKSALIEALGNVACEQKIGLRPDNKMSCYRDNYRGLFWACPCGYAKVPDLYGNYFCRMDSICQ